MLRKRNVWRTLLFSASVLTVSISFGGLQPVMGQAQSQGVSGSQQQAGPAPLSFEVASIKPSEGDPRMIRIGMQAGGRYTATGITLKMLLQQAYDVRDYQLTGLPGWASSDRYDIVAKAEDPNAGRDQIKEMLRSLLAERFNLKLHKETKDLPIYVLVVGKNGPKLKKSAIQPGSTPPPDAAKAADLNAAAMQKAVTAAAAMGKDAPVGANPAGGGTAGGAGGAVMGGGVMGKVGAGPVNVTALKGGGGGSYMSMGRGQLNAQGAPLALLVQQLSQNLGRPVIDKTGLTENYDYTLQWTPDESERGPGIAGGDRPEASAPGDSSGPSLFTAIQEQLGLKLDPQKGPVDIFVIDSVEKPSGN